MPWSGIFFWRNIGTNTKPRYAPPMRIHADGVRYRDNSGPIVPNRQAGDVKIRPQHNFISEYYIRCDFFDWFKTGRQDLITASPTGGINVYRNNGKLDPAGMPKLEHAIHIDLPKCLAPAPMANIRVIDWDNSGNPSFILGVAYGEYGFEFGQLLLIRHIGGTTKKPKYHVVPFASSNSWKTQSTKPISMNNTDWRQIQNCLGLRAYNFDYYDIDGDGEKEILLLHGKKYPTPQIEVCKNVGTIDAPVLGHQGYLKWSTHQHYLGFRFVKNDAFDGCVWGDNHGGFTYFQRTDNDPYHEKAYKNRGKLLGQGGKLRAEGYYCPRPVELHKKGIYDLIGGDEPGFLTQCKNIGTKEKPIYQQPQKIMDKNGNVLHLNRENLMHDNDGERFCGQLKPFVCDWDRDGKLDIILGNNTNRIYWLEQFNPKTNKIKAMHELKVKDCVDPFAWRKGPCVIDFDQDGQLEIITVDSQQRFCVFKKDPRDKTNMLLSLPIPLLYTNGQPISTDDIPPKMYRYGVCIIDVVDWNSNGSYDLLISANGAVALLENVGTNKKPRFKKPLALSTPDGTIDICHHESQVAACDWDHDGRLDIMLGGESGGTYLFHRDWLNKIQHKVTASKI